MLREIDNYFLRQEEPVRSCLLFLRDFILQIDDDITEAWKYRMPFYCYKEKMFCYLWVHKKTGQPYIGIVEGNKIDHPGLLCEKRSRMKILLIDADKDVSVEEVDSILQTALRLYKNK